MAEVFRKASPPPKETVPVAESNEIKSDESVSVKKNPLIEPVKTTQVCHVNPSCSQLQYEMLNSEKSEFVNVSEKGPVVSYSEAKEKLPKEESKVEETCVPISRNEEKRINSGTTKEGSDCSDDEWRKDFFPDYSKADFYCDICDAHMNSEQMWRNHVQGKRHLKNLRKIPGGLDFMSELQRSEPHLEHSHTCYFCHVTCPASSIKSHILDCTRRLANLRKVAPEEYALINNQGHKKSTLTSLAEYYALKLEEEKGCGKMEFKLEKTKMVPPPPINRTDKRYMTDNSEYYSKRANSGRSGQWRRVHYCDPRSPEPNMPSIPPLHPVNSGIPSNVQGLPTQMKLDLLHQLSDIIVLTEPEAISLLRIINSLTESFLQYKIRNLPPGIRDIFARHIISGDTESLVDALGLGGSEMADADNILSSLASAGELP